MSDRLTRTVARALRHAPDEFSLVLDAEGWTPVELLLDSIRAHDQEFHQLTKSDLENIALDTERFELLDGRMRARYGHSSMEIDYGAPQIPPAQLFHATSTRALADIVLSGLSHRSRRYLHLTSNWYYAFKIKERRTEEQKGGVILIVAARDAATKSGALFYKASESIWLTEAIAPAHLSVAVSSREGLLEGSRPLVERDERVQKGRLSSLLPDPESSS